MYNLLYRLWRVFKKEKLGVSTAYPIPWWFFYLAKKMRWSASQQMLQCSRLLKDADLSYIAPNEYGCAESVTRIWNALFGFPIFTATVKMYEYMCTSGKFTEIPHPIDGAITIAVTEFRNGETINGHTGVSDGGSLWNNNSPTGKWMKNWKNQFFISHFVGLKKLKVHHFIIK